MNVKKGNILKLLVAVVLVASLLISSLQFSASAEEIDETNPELKLAEIDSDVELQYGGAGSYVQDSYFSQGNGKYNLKTNAYVAWYLNDDIAFAYKVYNVDQNADGDYLEATVTVDSIQSYDPSTNKPENASIGLMFRSGLDSDDAEVFIHLRENKMLAVYRTRDGGDTLVQYTNNTVDFPVQLKMRKEKNVVKLSYKSASRDFWQDFKYPIGMNVSGPLYVGLAAHSCDKDTFINGNFSNLEVKGVGTYDGSGSGGNTSSDVSSEYVEEDSPIGSKVMLRETFSDGSITDGTESITNPIWDTPETFNLVNEDGNRVWARTFVDKNDYVGDWNGNVKSINWQNDYIVSVDVKFTENCNPDPEAASNTFRLFARHTGIVFYGHKSYSAVVTNGYKITLYRNDRLLNDASKDGTALKTVNLRTLLDDSEYSCLGDGIYHKLAIKVFDNKISVYWDDMSNPIIEYTDENNDKNMPTVGGVGVGTYQTDVYIDNLTVERIDDSFGGDYDNQIGGNWDMPIPDYVTDYTND